MVSAQGRRRQVARAVERGLSERSACALIGVARSTLRYRLRRPLRDETLRRKRSADDLWPREVETSMLAG